MKFIAVVAVACGGLFMASTLQAQATLTPAQQKRVADELKRFGGDLNLTGDQKDQLRGVLSDEVSQMDTVRNDTSLSKDDKASKIADIRKSGHSKIANILSPDQLKKWDAEAAKARDLTKK